MKRLLCLLPLACDGGGTVVASDTAGGAADSLAVGDTTGCADAPVVAWDNAVQGLFIEHCQPCHASTAVDRYGAPADVVFDTLDDALRWADRVRARTVEQGTMPPAGGVPVDDLGVLALWLECGADQR